MSGRTAGDDDHPPHDDASFLDTSHHHTALNNMSSSSAGSAGVAVPPPATATAAGVDEEGYSIRPQDQRSCQSSSDSDSGASQQYCDMPCLGVSCDTL